MAFSASTCTQQRTPFPQATAVIPLHMVIKFQKKGHKPDRKETAVKMQGPALRLGSKIHSLVRPAKNGRAISNGSQIGVGRVGSFGLVPF